MMKGSNPALKGLRNLSGEEIENRATYKGVAFKSLYFIGLTIIAAVVSAALLFKNPQVAMYLLFVSMAGSVIFALMSAFAPGTIKVSGTLYAVFEGVLVGAISGLLNYMYAGIVLAALLSTFGVFGVMMLLYATGVIKVTHKFRSYMYSALLGIVLINVVIFLLSLFVPAVKVMFYGSNWFTILISIGMVLFASFFILVDLYEITETVENGLDKKYEWRAAYGLTITLIWLYMEFLRLFARIKSK